MPRVVALYRYPVKGFTPEPVDRITVLPGGRVAGDRVLNFRFADAPVGPTEWCRKYHGVVLANTPGLARLSVRFDAQTQQVSIREGLRVVAEQRLDAAGRAALAAAITDYVTALEENPLRDHPERLPLALVGDGATPRYQDNAAGQVTLHSRASLAAAGVALEDPDLNERRFRHNIVIDGVRAWDELAWVGKGLRIGAVRFETLVPKVRCLATHANPATGERDRTVMQTLVRAFAQEQPTFGVGMLSAAGGEIALGDALSPL
jgi:uncharacterized protein YcbX